MAAKTRQLAMERVLFFIFLFFIFVFVFIIIKLINCKMRQLQNSFKTQNIKLIDSEQEQDLQQESNTFDFDDGEKAYKFKKIY
jgi:predicted Holliday junction resolvase-like endonuclease